MQRSLTRLIQTNLVQRRNRENSEFQKSIKNFDELPALIGEATADGS
jgi:hypothetical protein